MINTITLVGRMAVDPELKFTGSGKAVCSFRLAVDRQFKDAEGNRETDFFDIVAWQNSAEFVANYVAKGDLVGVVGRLQSRKWEAQDGSKRVSVEVVANDIRGLGGKKQAGDQPESSGDAKATSNGKPKAAAPKPAAVAAPESDDETPDFHDPFADI
jgi:single-strand DNA-binding protein